MTIRFSFVKVFYSNNNILQIQIIHSKNHIGRTFGYLKKLDSFGNFTIFFNLIIKKMSFYAEIATKNIKYGKLSRGTRYKKLVESIQKESDSSE